MKQKTAVADNRNMYNLQRIKTLPYGRRYLVLPDTPHNQSSIHADDPDSTSDNFTCDPWFAMFFSGCFRLKLLPSINGIVIGCDHGNLNRRRNHKNVLALIEFCLYHMSFPIEALLSMGLKAQNKYQKKVCPV